MKSDRLTHSVKMYDLIAFFLYNHSALIEARRPSSVKNWNMIIEILTRKKIY